MHKAYFDYPSCETLRQPNDRGENEGIPAKAGADARIPSSFVQSTRGGGTHASPLVPKSNSVSGWAVETRPLSTPRWARGAVPTPWLVQCARALGANTLRPNGMQRDTGPHPSDVRPHHCWRCLAARFDGSSGRILRSPGLIA